MKDLSSTKGTIASILTDRCQEIYTYAESPKQFPDLHKTVMEILDDKRLEKNPGTIKAKNILSNIYKKNQFNLYLSTLMTYMTGLKVN